MSERSAALSRAEAPGAQKKIAFCATELNERIEKRESMIKMGMENVADSLIPGFDKLEEQFVELVQQMKAVLGDFEPVRKQVEEAASGRCVRGGPVPLLSHPRMRC